MKLHTEIFAYLCILGLAQSVTLEEVDELGTDEDPHWWIQAPPDPRATKVGENVTLYAHITYDSEYDGQEKKPDHGSRNDKEDSTALTKYFEALFNKVETYFRNHSILINVTVSSVSKKQNLSVYNDRIFDAHGTLKNVIAYGKSLKKPSYTVFYHYTWTTSSFNKEGSIIPGTVDKSAVATNGTFCTEDTSAAVLRHRHKGGVYWSTAKATTLIFGSSQFLIIQEPQRKKMENLFRRCPKPTAEVVPAC